MLYKGANSSYLSFIMDENQHLAVKLATEGHSFIITGQAGSGKTWTLEKVVYSLRQIDKVVQVTATTGRL